MNIKLNKENFETLAEINVPKFKNITSKPYDSERIRDWVESHSDQKELEIAKKIVQSIRHVTMEELFIKIKGIASDLIKNYSDSNIVLYVQHPLENELLKDQTSLFIGLILCYYMKRNGKHFSSIVSNIDDLESFRRDLESSKDLVFVFPDDVSFTGFNISDRLTRASNNIFADPYNPFNNISYYIAVPFMSKNAINNLEMTSGVDEIEYPNNLEIIKSIDENEHSTNENEDSEDIGNYAIYFDYRFPFPYCSNVLKGRGLCELNYDSSDQDSSDNSDGPDEQYDHSVPRNDVPLILNCGGTGFSCVPLYKYVSSNNRVLSDRELRKYLLN